MLSLLKMSYGSSSSASYGIVSRSSSFTKNVFFGFFKFFVVFFLKFFWLLLPCFFYSFLHFLCLSLMCYLQRLLYFLPEINLLEVHYNQLFLYLLSFTKYVFFIFSYFCIFEGLFQLLFQRFFLEATSFLSSTISKFLFIFFLLLASTIFVNVFSCLILLYFFIIFLAVSLPDFFWFFNRDWNFYFALISFNFFNSNYVTR